MQITTGRYDIVEQGDTLTIRKASGEAPAAPSLDYPTYHEGLTRVTAARAARGQGPNVDIDAYRLIVEHNGDADALIRQNNAEPV